MTTNIEATPEKKSVVDIAPSEAYHDSTPFQLRQIANYFQKNVHELDPISFLVGMQWAHRIRNGEKDVSLAGIEHKQTVTEVTDYFAEEPDDENEGTPEQKPFVEPDPSGNA